MVKLTEDELTKILEKTGRGEALVGSGGNAENFDPNHFLPHSDMNHVPNSPAKTRRIEPRDKIQPRKITGINPDDLEEILNLQRSDKLVGG